MIIAPLTRHVALARSGLTHTSFQQAVAESYLPASSTLRKQEY